jgi:hypothetical protein
MRVCLALRRRRIMLMHDLATLVEVLSRIGLDLNGVVRTERKERNGVTTLAKFSRI